MEQIRFMIPKEKKEKKATLKNIFSFIIDFNSVFPWRLTAIVSKV